MIKANLYDTEFCNTFELNFQNKEQLHELLILNPKFEVHEFNYT